MRARPQMLPNRVEWIGAIWDSLDRTWRTPEGRPRPSPVAPPHAPRSGQATPGPTLVLAHEWLDEIPTTVAQRHDNGSWLALGPDGPVGPAPAGDAAWLDRWSPHAHHAESGLSRDVAWAAIAADLTAGGGIMVAVDYAHTAADRPPGGTFSAYREGRVVPPTADGGTNLTAHVAWDSLAAAVESVPGTRRILDIDQRSALMDHPAPLPEDDWGRLRARNRHRVLAAPDGLGSHRWLVHEVERAS